METGRINPFVLAAMREYQLKALYLSSLIQPDLAGNTAYLNPELYSMSLLPQVPPAPAILPQGQVMPQIPVTPQVPAAPALPQPALLPYFLNPGMESIMNRQYYNPVMLPPVLTDKKASGLPFDTRDAAATGAGALIGGLPMWALTKAPKKTAIMAATTGLAAYLASRLYRPGMPTAPDPRRVELAQMPLDSALTGAGIGGLAGAGLGYLANGAQGVLPFALTGAGLGGLGGFKYGQHRRRTAITADRLAGTSLDKYRKGNTLGGDQYGVTPPAFQTVKQASAQLYGYPFGFYPYTYNDKRAGLWGIARSALKFGGKLIGKTPTTGNVLARTAKLGKPTTLLGKAKNFIFGGLDHYEKAELQRLVAAGHKFANPNEITGVLRATRNGSKLNGTFGTFVKNNRFNEQQVNSILDAARKGRFTDVKDISGLNQMIKRGDVTADQANRLLKSTFGGHELHHSTLKMLNKTYAGKFDPETRSLLQTRLKMTRPTSVKSLKSNPAAPVNQQSTATTSEVLNNARQTPRPIELKSSGQTLELEGNAVGGTAPASNKIDLPTQSFEHNPVDFTGSGSRFSDIPGGFWDSAKHGTKGFFNPAKGLRTAGQLWSDAFRTGTGYRRAAGYTAGLGGTGYGLYQIGSNVFGSRNRDSQGYTINHF